MRTEAHKHKHEIEELLKEINPDDIQYHDKDALKQYYKEHPEADII